MLDAVLRDGRLALRAMRTHPRFTALAVAAYAVGIGAVTAIFSLVDDVLLDPLPWPDAEEVVAIWERYPPADADRVPAAPAKIDAWAASAGTFAGVAAWRLESMDLAGEGAPERIPVGLVEPGIFDVLGVDPALGRGFLPGEAEPGGAEVLILTHRAWRERAGADPDVIGRSLVLDGRPRTIVGVLPEGTAWPADAEVIAPLVIDVRESRVSHAFRVLARLRPGVSPEDAQRELDVLAARLAEEHPATDDGWEVTVTSLRGDLVGDLDRTLLYFQGSVALLLLLACSNVASLLLVRAAGRRREMAVRTSLGASRSRLVRQLTSENLVLALVGGAAGLVLAGIAVRAILVASPVELPRTVGTRLDGTVLAFALAVSIAAGLVFGLLPALRGTGVDLMTTLRESGRTAAAGHARLRRIVVGAEIALATLILVGSALFQRSLSAVGDVDPGFVPSGLLAVQVEPPRYRYASAAERLGLYGLLLDAVDGAPGVDAAALASHIPLGRRFDTFRFQVEGRPAPETLDANLAQIRAVTPGYFDVMGTPVREGRPFEGTDGQDGEPVAMINGTMARRYWPGERALGARVSLAGPEGPWLRVVGIADDVRSAGVTAEPVPELYVPMAQESWPRAELVVRTTGEPLDALPAVRSAVAEVDPVLPLALTRTFSSLVERDRAPWRFQALLTSVFGTIAAGLAALGVAGLLGYVVQERRGELGVRKALGATAGHIQRLVAGDALVLALVGTAVGLAAGALLSRLVEGMLYGVSALDPWSYAASALALLALAAGAAWWPARRAARIEPSEALRSD